jgi:hypothetical protein
MMSKGVMVDGVLCMPGSRAYELMQSKDKVDHNKARTLVKFCDECEKAGYEYSAVQRLREKYKEVV